MVTTNQRIVALYNSRRVQCTGGPVTDKGLYDQAKSFSESISKGSVKAKHGEDKPKDQSSII